MIGSRLIFSVALFIVYTNKVFAQCEVTASVNPVEIVCGDCAELSAFGRGQGQLVFSENFNSGAPTGWAFTQQARFDNPCSPNGVDGTTHIWMGNTSAVPRSLVTLPYNFSTAISGVTICFDMLFSRQADAAPCEGPDEPDEGVYLQYQIGAGPWQTIHYFDPNGGNDPQLVNWTNWCFQLPAGASTANVSIRWFQDNDSGADFDHWGIDNVVIYFNDPSYQITWQHDNYSYPVGVAGGVSPNPACPRITTDYFVVMTNGVQVCRDTVTVQVRSPTVEVDAGTDTTVCLGDCATLHATAKVIRSPGGPKTYFTFEPDTVTSVFGALSPGLVNINVTQLNMTNITPNSILRVCIDSAAAYDVVIFPGLPPLIPPIIADNHLRSFTFDLICPDGTIVTLIPENVLTDTINNDIRGACFVVAGGGNIASATPPYSGSFNPVQPLANMNGCTANGIWTLRVSSILGSAIIKGWSITFDDIEINYPADFTWSPTTNMSASNTLTPTVCPTGTQDYTLTAEDTAGCVVTSDIVRVTVIPNCCQLAFTATSTPPSCTVNDGTISLNITNGSGNYSFLWNDNQTTQNRTGLGAGTYSVTITDVTANCDRDTTITLTSPNAPVINSVNVTHEVCLGDSDGTATANASGGTGTLTYTWSTTQSGQSITGVAAGNHFVTVTDANSCSAVETFTINPGVSCCSLQIAASVTQPDCAQTNGGIDMTPTGSGNYSYLWNPSATTEDLTGIGAGTYSVTVTDLTQNCDRDTTITLSNPNAPTITNITSTPEVCLGDEDGTATVTASGGTGILSYLWNNNETTTTITGLAPGTYFVTVTDANLCETSSFIAVQAGQICCELTSTVTTINTSCNTADGSITINVDVTSGTAPFSYSIDGTNFGSTNVFDNLAAGTYDAIARDVNLCVHSNTVTITEANNTIQATVSSTGITCFGDDDGTATVDASGGNAPLTILWSTNSANTTITDLSPGTYTVTVTDQLNCQQTATATIAEPVQLTVNIGGDQSICTGDTARFTLPGTFATMQWSNNQSSATVFFFQPGAVSVTVTDANGCTASDLANVMLNNAPTVDAGLDTTIYDFDVVLLDPVVSGSVNPSGFIWAPSTGLSCTDCENPVASPDSTVLYYVYYTDNNGCPAFDSVLVTVLDGDVLAVVPNAFSPNGDGENDVLYVYHKGLERLVFRVYNRWGSMLFESRDPNIGWDGTFKGKELNPDVFVYELYAEFFDRSVNRTTGSVTLLR